MDATGGGDGGDGAGAGAGTGGAGLGSATFISVLTTASPSAQAILLPPPKTPPKVPVPEIKIDRRPNELTPSCE